MSQFSVIPKSDGRHSQSMEAIKAAQSNQRSAFDFVGLVTAYNLMDQGAILEFVYPLKNPARLAQRLAAAGLLKGGDYLLATTKRGEKDFLVSMTRNSTAVGTIPAPAPRKKAA